MRNENNRKNTFFETFSDAAYHLLDKRKQLFAFNSTNAFLQFLLEVNFLNTLLGPTKILDIF